MDLEILFCKRKIKTIFTIWIRLIFALRKFIFCNKCSLRYEYQPGKTEIIIAIKYITPPFVALLMLALVVGLTDDADDDQHQDDHVDE